MKIKLLVLDKDANYLNRISSVFYTKYPDKFEIYSFTEQDTAMLALDVNKIDVFLASDLFEVDVRLIPRRCGFAYMVDSADVDTIKEQRAICKYQKVDLIYKQILSIYSENFGNTSGLKFNDENAKVIIFSSPSGGVGTSSMAAACAVHYAMQGKKVLYLNLEKFGSADVFFSGEGQFDMSDIIYTLKSKKTNLALKLESCVKQDISGVYFYSQSKRALDMHELSYDDMIKLISELIIMGTYDYILVDMDFGISEKELSIYRKSHAIVWVADGTEISNMKINRSYSAIATVEQAGEIPITNRLCLIYNKFSNKTGKAVEGVGLRNAGGAPRYEHASVLQIIQQLSNMEMFDKILRMERE